MGKQSKSVCLGRSRVLDREVGISVPLKGEREEHQRSRRYRGANRASKNLESQRENALPGLKKERKVRLDNSDTNVNWESGSSINEGIDINNWEKKSYQGLSF